MFFDPVFQVGSGERGNPLPGAVTIRDIPALIRFLKRHGDGSFRVVYQPKLYPDKQLDAVCTLLREVRDTVLCIDELPLFCSASWTPEPLALFARAGRHYGITMMWTAQRPSDVSRLVRSVTNQWRVFRLQDSRDVEALRGRVPDQALTVVPTLPKWTHVEVNESSEWRIVKP